MATGGQAAFGVIGAVVGHLVPVVGVFVGLSIGLMVGGLLFPPTPEGEGNPTKPLDLQIQTSQYGSPVKVMYGKRRFAGNVIWYDNFLVHENTEEAGGKGGGGQGVSSTYYTYSVSFAIGVCMGTRTITKIWQGKELIYPPSGDNTIRIYNGTQTTADSHIASFTARDPVYKGLCYVVFEDFNLGTQTNVPNFTFEVAQDATTTAPSLDSTFGGDGIQQRGLTVTSTADSANIYAGDGINDIFIYDSDQNLTKTWETDNDADSLGIKLEQSVILGSDSNKHKANKTHNPANNDTFPITGDNYATYWSIDNTKTVNETWAQDKVFIKSAGTNVNIKIDKDNGILYVLNSAHKSCTPLK
jgi:hypothetical protein